MNKKKKQNGFTIVELVIVIAVIGILAAVLIPTFSNLIKKSKQSADQQLVYHLNEAVIANETDNLAKGKNGTEATMYDTLQVLDKEYGFTVERMTPRSGNDIVWDSTTNRFALVAKDNTVVYTDPNRPTVDMTNKAQMWRITEAGESLTDGYAHYLTAGWTGEVPAVATGVDVGDNDDITSVNYARTATTEVPTQTVVIRTNSASTSLTIDAAADTVKHYGAVGSLNIIAVANASYHEFGQVAFAEIATGRIVLEQKSEVEHIHVNAKENPANNENAFAEVIIAKDASVEMPDLSRDDVEIAANGTLVVVLQSGTSEDAEKDYVWLTKQGVYEQITISNNDESAGNVWVNTSSKPEETKTAAKQIANNIGRNASGEILGTVTVENVEYTVTFNESTRELVVTNTATSEVVDASTVVEETGLTNVEKEAAKAETVAQAIQAEEDATPAWTLDGASYATSEEMLAALADKNEATLILNKDITVVFGLPQYYFTVTNGQTLTIDLNGHKINVTDKNLTTSAFIKNQGTLIIKDSTDTEKNGTGMGAILYEATHPDYQSVPNYANNLISNYGNLTVESGYFGTNGVYNSTFAQEGYASFAIDNYSGGTVTINGGKFFREAQKSYAIRMFCNSTTNVNKVTVNGGIIEGGYAFWMQTPNDNANMAELIVNGGTFIAHDGFALFFGGAGSTSKGRNYSNTSIVFNGGTLNGVGVAGVSSEDNAPARFEISSVAILELSLGPNLTPTYK